MNENRELIDVDKDAAQSLPRGVRIAAAWSWRLIIIGVGLAAVLWLLMQVQIIVIPLLVAILLTALLRPVVDFVMKLGLPKWIGVLTAMLSLIAAIGILSYLVFTRFRTGFAGLRYATIRALDQLMLWLEKGVFGFSFSAEQMQKYLDDFMQLISIENSTLWSGALEIGTTVGHLLMGTVLALFATIFLLIDGDRIWIWVLSFLPSGARAGADAGGKAGWISVGQYVRVQIFVAFVDALGIGVGAAILGLPLVVPLSILVFLASFIPFLGAITTGILAAFVALVYNGPVSALIMLIIVVAVNQIEGHILQPLVMGNAVKVHPLGVVLAVSAGALVAGIPGALFAVPLVASLNSMVHAVQGGKWRGRPDPVKQFHDRERTVKQAKIRLKSMHRKGTI